ncbi:hypothetical protein ACOSQ3_010613 [Xanthoceras sorbifolium]
MSVVEERKRKEQASIIRFYKTVLGWDYDRFIEESEVPSLSSQTWKLRLVTGCSEADEFHLPSITYEADKEERMSPNDLLLLSREKSAKFPTTYAFALVEHCQANSQRLRIIFFSSYCTTFSSLSSLAHAAPFCSHWRRHTFPLAATVHLAPPHVSRSPSLTIASLSIVRDCHFVADFNLGS